MRILGVETSCDETAVCLIEAEGDLGAGFSYKALGNALYSQAKLHEQYGGVFPNLAKREHAKNLVPMLQTVLEQANIPKKPSILGRSDLVSISPGVLSRSDLDTLRDMLAREPELYEQLTVLFDTYTRPDIDCIAVTHGPGLEPCLWVGVNFAKALSLAWNIPIVGVNHMEGHILLSMMEKEKLSQFQFPLLALLISGGHTELVLSREWMHYEIVGQTRDDAAGEAFDKVARLLGLPYPGGPEIGRLAAETRAEGRGSGIKLPRPMLHEDNLDFSFAGLKTAVRKLVEQSPERGPTSVEEKMKKEIAMEFENAVADVLVEKTMRAIDQFGANTLVVGGGVSANTYIRERLAKALQTKANRQSFWSRRRSSRPTTRS